MKKSSIVNLIKCFTDHNDYGFRAQAAEIANEFESQGDSELSEYIMSMIATTDVFSPQFMEDTRELDYCTKTPTNSHSIYLPRDINEDVLGIVNAIGYNVGVNKFMFSGAPGTGKTETVKQIARMLNRELFSVDFDLLIDSKLGQTAKNIAELFTEINNMVQPERTIILLDEIDSIAMDRIGSNDIREMGRATSALMRGLDSISSKITLFATTNLIDHFDKALLRRFDSIVSFNRYTREELLEISENLLEQYIKIFDFAKKDMRLFDKIINEYLDVPYPGELSNIIKTALAFSNNDKSYDYLRIIYKNICKEEPTIPTLKNKGYSLRQIEKLTGISKSSVARETTQLI